MPGLAFAGSMLVFGTIGLLRRFIDLPSAVIACFRGLLGCVLLLLLQRLRGRKPDLAALRRYLPALLISGGMIGFNWMLLFEAYRYTTIAVATLCYYMAPVLLIAFSPLLFKEKLTGRQIVCVLLAALGMVLVSGALDGSGLNDGAMTASRSRWARPSSTRSSPLSTANISALSTPMTRPSSSSARPGWCSCRICC